MDVGLALGAARIAPDKVRTSADIAQYIDHTLLKPEATAADIEKLCDEVIAAHPGPAADYKAGKAAALNFLKGQVMKLSKGKANPALAGEIIERKLKPAKVQAKIGKSACDQCRYCTEYCPRFLLGYAVEPHQVMRSLAFTATGAERAVHVGLVEQVTSTV